MHWQEINEAEIAAGEALGKPRQKIVDFDSYFSKKFG
jgi:hypothetical protein